MSRLREELVCVFFLTHLAAGSPHVFLNGFFYDSTAAEFDFGNIGFCG